MPTHEVPIGQSTELAQTPSALADKYLFTRLDVYWVIALVYLVLFLAFNEYMGRLISWQEYGWALLKGCVPGIIVGAGKLLVFVCMRLGWMS